MDVKGTMSHSQTNSAKQILDRLNRIDKMTRRRPPYSNLLIWKTRLKIEKGWAEKQNRGRSEDHPRLSLEGNFLKLFRGKLQQ
jgi:hypothetical protein